MSATLDEYRKVLKRRERCSRCGGKFYGRHDGGWCSDRRDHDQYGEAPVIRVTQHLGGVWTAAVACPLEGCHKGWHTHGLGSEPRPDPTMLGDRVAHCGLGGYSLVDPFGLLS